MGRKGYSTERERLTEKAIKNAIQDRLSKHREKVKKDMQQYKRGHARLTLKVKNARQYGMTYGYYVALVLDRQGRLNF